MSGRGRGGPGPARLYAVPWGWGVRLRGALWSRMLVRGAGRQVRRQMTAWGVKQGLERIGVPAASPGWGEGVLKFQGWGAPHWGPSSHHAPPQPCRDPIHKTFGAQMPSAPPLGFQREHPSWKQDPRHPGGHRGLGLPVPTPTPTPSSGRASWGSGLVTTTRVPKQAAVWSVLWRPRPCTQHSFWGWRSARGPWTSGLTQVRAQQGVARGFPEGLGQGQGGGRWAGGRRFPIPRGFAWPGPWSIPLPPRAGQAFWLPRWACQVCVGALLAALCCQEPCSRGLSWSVMGQGVPRKSCSRLRFSPPTPTPSLMGQQRPCLCPLLTTPL